VQVKISKNDAMLHFTSQIFNQNKLLQLSIHTVSGLSSRCW